MKIVVGSLVAVALVSARADACGVPDFGGLAQALGDALDPKPEHVETPVVVVGGGATIDGTVGSIAVGYAWGDRDRGGMFAGSEVTRVLIGLRTGDDHPAMALTYGWYENQIMSAGLDVGAEATTTGLGPTTRLTLGAGGIALRVTGGVTFEPDPHVVASAEVVLELADMIGKL